MRAGSVAALAAAALLLLSGCSADATGPEGIASSGPAAAVPTFSGPWAAEFADAYRSTHDPVAHRVLADETITDQDYSEISDSFVACLKGRGFTAAIDDAYGRFTITDGDGDDPRVRAALRECSPGFDAVSGLRAQMLRNPQHRDENEIVVACLIAAGLVDKGYTAADYEREISTERFSFDADGSAATDCFRDPLRTDVGRG